MNLLATAKVRCPKCGKNLMVNVDISTPQESWIEECKFCRQSLQLASDMSEGTLNIKAEPLKQ